MNKFIILKLNLFYGVFVALLATVLPLFVKNFSAENVWLGGIFWVLIMILNRLTIFTTVNPMPDDLRQKLDELEIQAKQLIKQRFAEAFDDPSHN